jgi:hypothetical protein
MLSGQSRDRTGDLAIFSRSLYQLSYLPNRVVQVVFYKSFLRASQLFGGSDLCFCQSDPGNSFGCCPPVPRW